MTTSPHKPGGRQNIEQPDPTHQLLLRAATELFLARGFSTTSIRQIIQHAGLRRSVHGLSKITTGHDVADALCDQAIARVQRSRPRDVDELIAMSARWTEMAIARPGWLRLELQLAAHGDDGDQRGARRSGRLRHAAAVLLTDVGSDTDTANPIAMFVWSTIFGFACRNAYNLDVPRAEIEQHIGYVLRLAVT